VLRLRRAKEDAEAKEAAMSLELEKERTSRVDTEKELSKFNAKCAKLQETLKLYI